MKASCRGVRTSLARIGDMSGLLREQEKSAHCQVLERVAEKLGSCEAVAVKQYSVDLRERLLEAIDAGLPQAEAARLFGIGVSTIKRWRRRRRETGVVTARPRPGRRPLVDPGAAPTLVAQVRATPDATLAEHCTRWEETTGIRVSRATMSRALRRAGWPLKKSRSSPPSETSPPARHGGTRLPPLIRPP